MKRYSSTIFLTCGLLLAASGVCHAQKGGAPQSATTSPSSDPSAKPSAPTEMLGGLGDSPEKVRAAVEAQARENALERQKKNSKDSAKLIALGEQVKAEIAGLTADQYPPSVIKKLEEMEKLARDIKKRLQKA